MIQPTLKVSVLGEGISPKHSVPGNGPSLKSTAKNVIHPYGEKLSLFPHESIIQPMRRTRLPSSSTDHKLDTERGQDNIKLFEKKSSTYWNFLNPILNTAVKSSRNYLFIVNLHKMHKKSLVNLYHNTSNITN